MAANDTRQIIQSLLVNLAIASAKRLDG